MNNNEIKRLKKVAWFWIWFSIITNVIWLIVSLKVADTLVFLVTK